jgi:transposase
MAQTNWRPAVEHIAIDLGGRESQVCIRSPDGRILKEERVLTRDLQRVLSEVKGRVIIETCAEAFRIADLAQELGQEVRVVPASLVRTLGVGARKTKTDRRDAQVLSEVSCRIDLPSVHVPSQWSRETKSLCGMRDGLVQSRTQLINTVRGWLRGGIQRLATKGTKTFPRRVRALLEKAGRPVPSYVDRQLGMIEELSKRIAEADEEVKQRVQESEVCRRLNTAVGPITALRYAATLDEVSRFSGAHQVEAYLGLTPGEDSSSDRKRITSITKAGSSALRWTLVQACWSVWRTRPKDPLSLWADEVARRRGRRVAIVAMARKMAGILYAMWRDGTEYNPARTNRPLDVEEQRKEIVAATLERARREG